MYALPCVNVCMNCTCTNECTLLALAALAQAAECGHGLSSSDQIPCTAKTSRKSSVVKLCTVRGKANSHIGCEPPGYPDAT